MNHTNVPDLIWDFSVVTESEIMSRISIEGRRSGLELITGDSVDIQGSIDFEFYDLIWYQDNPEAIGNPFIELLLGICHRVRSALCYWILTDKGIALSRTTVQHLTIDYNKDPTIADKVKDYTDTLGGNIGYLN